MSTLKLTPEELALWEQTFYSALPTAHDPEAAADKLIRCLRARLPQEPAPSPPEREAKPVWRYFMAGDMAWRTNSKGSENVRVVSTGEPWRASEYPWTAKQFAASDEHREVTREEAEAMLRLVFGRTRPELRTLRDFEAHEYDADGELCAAAEASMTDTDEAAIVLGVYARHAERIEEKVAEAGR